MKLRILGNCGPYPSAGGACSGYLLMNDEESVHILIDCGTGCLQALQKYTGVDCLDAIILSHLHYDHMSDILPMIYALQFSERKEVIPVFAPSAPKVNRVLLDQACFETHDPADFDIGNIHISFMKVRHPVETYSVRFECGDRSFVYTGDTNTCEGLSKFSSNADLLLADAGLNDADWAEEKPHLSARLCGILAKESNAKRLLLTHFNPKYEKLALVAEAKKAFGITEASSVNALYII